MTLRWPLTCFKRHLDSRSYSCFCTARRFQLAANWPPERYLFPLADPHLRLIQTRPICPLWYPLHQQEAQVSQRERATRYVSWNLVNCCMRSCTKNSIWKHIAMGEWPWTLLKVIGIAVIRQTTYHFLLVICSNNISMLHRFGDSITFAVYMTACDLQKSFGFDKTVEIRSHTFVRCQTRV